MRKGLKFTFWLLYFLGMVTLMTYLTKGASESENSPEIVTPISNPASPPNQNPDPMDMLKKNLSEKDALLMERERELNSVKSLLSQKEEEIRSLKNRIKQLTDELERIQNAKIAKLSKVYSEMEPKQAAELLKALGKSAASEILASMREREAARIMEEMDPEFVKELTLALGGMERKGSR